jgi:Putative DNA-binding domain
LLDLFTADFNNLGNDALYSAVADFARAQPVESNRHDFKTVWNNDTLKDVAAFANTFGGILVIGVEKGQADAEAKLVGVMSGSELTTGIASAIATNISPTPSYDIMECHKPGETNKRFCVIRVRSDATLHLVTKKGINNPVWVRNADQTIPADAAQLRMMIDREKQSVTDAAGSLLARAHRMFEDMIVRQSYADWPLDTYPPEKAYFKLALIPAEMKLTVLDVRSENEFLSLIHKHYRRVQSNLTGQEPVAADAVNRSSDFYEYRWYHRNLDYEGRWRITNRLDLAHATQIKHDSEWSLVDVVVYSILMLVIGAKWWESLKYFGDGILVAVINVQNLQLARGASRQFSKLFGPGEGDPVMGAEVLDVHVQQRAEANASVSVNFASMRDNIPGLVTTLMNSLLRSLGHGVVSSEFENDVRLIVSRTVHQ